jgi:hypothetical protein
MTDQTPTPGPIWHLPKPIATLGSGNHIIQAEQTSDRKIEQWAKIPTKYDILRDWVLFTLSGVYTNVVSAQGEPLIKFDILQEFLNEYNLSSDLCVSLKLPESRERSAINFVNLHALRPETFDKLSTWLKTVEFLDSERNWSWCVKTAMAPIRVHFGDVMCFAPVTQFYAAVRVLKPNL